MNIVIPPLRPLPTLKGPWQRPGHHVPIVAPVSAVGSPSKPQTADVCTYELLYVQEVVTNYIL